MRSAARPGRSPLAGRGASPLPGPLPRYPPALRAEPPRPSLPPLAPGPSAGARAPSSHPAPVPPRPSAPAPRRLPEGDGRVGLSRAFGVRRENTVRYHPERLLWPWLCFPRLLEYRGWGSSGILRCLSPTGALRGPWGLEAPWKRVGLPLFCWGGKQPEPWQYVWSACRDG